MFVLSRIGIMALALAVTLALVPAAGPVPARAGGMVKVEVCRDVGPSGGVDCGSRFPAGSPWVAYRVTGAGAPVDIVVERPDGDYVCVSRGDRNGWQTCHTGLVIPGPGVWRVIVQDSASHETLAETDYEYDHQAPEEAIAAYSRGQDAWSRAAVVLAKARLGRTGEALDDAQAMAGDPNTKVAFEGLLLRTAILSAAGRHAEAERAAQDLIAWIRAHGFILTPGEVARLALEAAWACDIPEAERAAGQASLLAPGDPEVQKILVFVEQRREACGAKGGGQ